MNGGEIRIVRWIGVKVVSRHLSRFTKCTQYLLRRHAHGPQIFILLRNICHAMHARFVNGIIL